MKFFKPLVQGTLLLLAAPVQAQEMPAVYVDIASCMALEIDQERHACYDRLAASVRAAQLLPSEPEPGVRTIESAPALATDAQAEVPEPATSAVENFGELTAAEARVLANEAGEEELHDRIADLREREPGRWLITLDSGQVWYQTNSGRIRLSKGMDVRIYPSPLGGSFRLTGVDGASTGFIQVRRIE